MERVSVNGLSLSLYGASDAPIALLLHGHSQTGAMWRRTALLLAGRGLRVLVPDLPGIGESTALLEDHRKTNVAAHIRSCLQPDLIHNKPINVIGHDLGAMVAYAYAAGFPDEVQRLVMMETPIAGLPPWDDLLRMPQTWHFGFYGPHCEALVKDREDIFLEHFWTEMSANPSAITEESRREYIRAYSRNGAMRSCFNYFSTFSIDAKENVELSQQKISCPVLTCGGELSMGQMIGQQAKHYASDVHDVVIEKAAHYLIEENPEMTDSALSAFLTA